MRALSDRLAAIGVMDQAIALIQPQMESATDPTVKAKLGARIAALRLLDDKPDLALKALASSDLANIDDGLKTERKLLQARALFKSGKPDDAVAALQGLQSREADALRVEIAWSQKKWADAAAALARLAGPPAGRGHCGHRPAGEHYPERSRGAESGERPDHPGTAAQILGRGDGEIEKRQQLSR